jgi:ketosteroid isomerase-like protein
MHRRTSGFAAVLVALILIATLTGLSSRAAEPGLPVGAGDVEAVKAVLSAYNTATQKLDLTGTERLFAPDSEIVESGSVEGTYAHYLQNHIRPELSEFKSFTFQNYAVRVQIIGTFALATETFGFRIEPKSGEPVERLAVATSVLHKIDGEWKIVRYHWSSQRPPVKP